MSHPWMKGDVKSKAEVKAEFKERKGNMDAIVEKDKKEKKTEQATRHAQRVMRGAGGQALEEQKMSEESKSELPPSKQLLDYEKVFAQNTEFFSACNPDLIEEALVQHLKEREHVDPKVNKDHYKIKFKLITKGQDAQEQETEICVRILKVDGTYNCVEFTKLKGNQVNFHEHFNEITRTALNFSNDTVAPIDGQ